MARSPEMRQIMQSIPLSGDLHSAKELVTAINEWKIGLPLLREIQKTA